MPDKTELVTITVDGVEIKVPKGTNLIEAAHLAGVDVPYYCYHPHLSIAGNCRMCQVEVKGMPKLTIACNTGATEGMVVQTQKTSERVADAQRATLEFLLINHPLDCTVCDQAGHCKLQDYYYEYNRTPSRFIEDKVHKVKAEPLGPEVIYDGERCILCTRCVRFCEEVTGTRELGVFNRGDHAVIGIYDNVELTNPLSGTVVDLCPVGALTHRRWRFNSRIWYTNEADNICMGCSTGCNVKVAVRDGQVVQVKARLNAEVNKEWLCDEGRYGFMRFQPEVRLQSAISRQANGEQKSSTLEEAYTQCKSLLGSGEGAVFISPQLTLEEMWVTFRFAERVMGITPESAGIAVQCVERELSAVEKVLISNDYAANARATEFFGLCSGENWRPQLESRYRNLLGRVRSGAIKRILLVGDNAIRDEDLDASLAQALKSSNISVALTSRGATKSSGYSSTNGSGVPTEVQGYCSVLFPSRTVHEKRGVVVNRDLRLQRLQILLDAPFNTIPEWMSLINMAKAVSAPLFSREISDERALFREMIKEVPVLRGLSLSLISGEGLAFEKFKDLQRSLINSEVSEVRA